MRKAEKSGQDPYIALLEQRNTPISEEMGSPVQILFGRRTQSSLPIHSSLLNSTLKSDKIQEQLHKRQINQKQYYDRGSHIMKPLNPGDYLRINDNNKECKTAVVVRRGEQPRSYVIDSGEKEYVRNRRDLIKVKSANIEKPVIPEEVPIPSRNVEKSERVPTSLQIKREVEES